MAVTLRILTCKGFMNSCTGFVPVEICGGEGYRHGYGYALVFNRSLVSLVLNFYSFTDRKSVV